MKLIFLSQDFYTDYSQHSEIMAKNNRPYACFTIMIDSHLFAIPLRHHINHPFAYITVGNCGLDYSKAVVVDDPRYISSATPTIDSKEWNLIKAGYDVIFREFKKYLHQYKRALKHPDNPRSDIYLKYGTLKYFDIS